MATGPSFDPASVEAIAELLSTCMYRSWYSELVAAGLPLAAVVTGHKFQLNIDIGDDAVRSSRQVQYTQAIDAIDAYMDSRDAPPEEFVVVGLALSTVISDGVAAASSRVAAGVRRGDIAPEIALAIVLAWNQYTSIYAECLPDNANVADAIAGAFRQLDRGIARLQLPPVIV